MINDISKVKVGDKVHYMPDYKIKDNIYENGIVKEIPENQLDSIRVVYNCCGDWKNYKDYTSQLTNTRDLYIGWNHSKSRKEKELEDHENE